MAEINRFTFRRAVTYTHTQDVEAVEWNIEHRLNGYPVTDILYDDNGVLTKMIAASIDYIDAHNLKITFTSPRKGVARLVG